MKTIMISLAASLLFAQYGYCVAPSKPSLPYGRTSTSPLGRTYYYAPSGKFLGSSSTSKTSGNTYYMPSGARYGHGSTRK